MMANVLYEKMTFVVVKTNNEPGKMIIKNTISWYVCARIRNSGT